jgi:hypothetical protein
VISFFAFLKERGIKGPHLVVVPYVYFRLLQRLDLAFTHHNQVFYFRKLVPRICPFRAVDIGADVLRRKRGTADITANIAGDPAQYK